MHRNSQDIKAEGAASMSGAKRGPKVKSREFQWERVDRREYLELTSKQVQYYWLGGWTEDGYPYRSDGEFLWVAKVQDSDGCEWVQIGRYRTGLEARRSAEEWLKQWRKRSTEAAPIATPEAK
jgi:hypothetical protein